jgi:hypothetical protein
MNDFAIDYHAGRRHHAMTGDHNHIGDLLDGYLNTQLTGLLLDQLGRAETFIATGTQNLDLFHRNTPFFSG